MKRIPLTQGKFAIVDDEDFERLSKHKWYAWKQGDTYYAVRNIGRKPNRSNERMHRVVMNAQKGQEIDHINRNGLDNRRCNLRLCTHSQNMGNVKSYKNSSSRFKGVCWNKINKNWRSYIRINGKMVNLGSFINEVDAARAYDRAAIKYFKEFAYTNFPRTNYA